MKLFFEVGAHFSLGWRLALMLRRILNRHFLARPFPPLPLQFARSKETSTRTYSVVTATHNCAHYLDDYFKSITRQSLDFASRIQLIVVDDGSTDRTEAVIKKWTKRHPDNIIHLRQRNRGPGAARNLGLTRAANDYVTFIDADDYVSRRYFEQADRILSQAPDVAMLTCKSVMVYELTGNVRDHHSLRVFHGSEDIFKDLHDRADFIQVSASSAFFPLAELRKRKLTFSESRWPAFEDAHFGLRYLMGVEGGRLAFGAAPVYYYRKRCRKNSTMDLARNMPEFYDQLLREAHLELLATRVNGPAPTYVQKTVLYDLAPKIRAALAKNANLTEDGERRFLALLDEIFQFIDLEVIVNYPEALNGFSDLCRAGVLGRLKGLTDWISPVTVDRCRPAENMIRLRYCTGRPDQEIILSGDQSIKIVEAKTTTHRLGGEIFCYEQLLWLSWPDKSTSFNILSNNRPLVCKSGPDESLDFDVDKIKKCFKVDRPPKDPGLWLFLDRLDQADDNAEHLYRYTAARDPGRKIYFVLKRNSPDWPRLEREGFRLVDFGSQNFRRLLAKAGKIISSQTDLAPGAQFPSRSGQHFIFLQHGVINNDISAWLNTFALDLMVTSTAAEYDSIAGPGSPYLLSPREVVQTGLPRHDALMKAPDKSADEIMIAPTWRPDFCFSLNQEPNCLGESAYVRNWLEFLNSPELTRMAKQKGLRVVFAPHPNASAVFKDAPVAEEINCVYGPDIDYQTHLNNAAILITDYSSLAFDAAFMQKVCLYYQFDKGKFFSRSHAFARGYFDYNRNGFGPVCGDLESLLLELKKLLTPTNPQTTCYLERMRATFPVRDGCNCERVYQAILTLDERR